MLGLQYGCKLASRVQFEYTERKRNVVLSFDHHFRDHKDAFARSRIPQATQVPADHLAK